MNTGELQLVIFYLRFEYPVRHSFQSCMNGSNSSFPELCEISFLILILFSCFFLFQSLYNCQTALSRLQTFFQPLFFYFPHTLYKSVSVLTGASVRKVRNVTSNQQKQVVLTPNQWRQENYPIKKVVICELTFVS